MASQRASPTPQTDLRQKPLFARFARWVERQVGRSSTFVLAIAIVLLWAAFGQVFGSSDTWQLVINTGTTIITFLMVFVIQNTQSRDTQAMQLKLDELIRVNEIARNSLINLEEMSEPDVERNVRTRCRADEGSLHGARLTANCTTQCSGRGMIIGRIAPSLKWFDP
jgi:low affinity Fe/Cu permease